MYLVLVADNIELSARHLAVKLENYGYQTHTVFTPEDALKALQTNWFDAAILDLRLRDDHNSYDISGIEVAMRANTPVPVIIRSGFASFEALLEFIRQREGIPDTFDYILKWEPLENLLQALEEAIKKSGYHAPLEIKQQKGFSFLSMALQLEEDEDLSILSKRTREIEALFHKLMGGPDRSITVYPMPKGGGEASLVLAQPTGKYGKEDFRVVKIGRREKMRDERHRFDECVRRLVSLEGAPQLGDYEETLHYGALEVSVLGGNKNGNFETLTDFYQTNHEIKNIEEVLTHLFTNTCEIWYLSQKMREGKELVGLYRTLFDLDGQQQEFETCMNDLIPLRVSGEKLEILEDKRVSLVRKHGLSPLYLPNPVEIIFNVWDEASKHYPENREKIDALFYASVPFCIVHGDLHGDNVLIDEDRNTWILDFARTGISFALRDFIQLESVFTMEMVRTHSLSKWFDYLWCLFQPRGWSERIPKSPDLPSDLQKSLKAAQHLRDLANDLVKEVDIRLYYYGLLFHAARLFIKETSNPLQGPRSPQVKKAHALLACALIAYRLLQWPAWNKRELTK
ncbi:MAG: hypothetical protein Fur0022_18790 [Anaerolineales bacterium]